MSTYGFRIRFLLPEKTAINYNADTLEIKLPIGNKTIELRSFSKNKIKDSNHLIVRGSGFASEQEAYEYGTITKNSLILCSTILKMGINIGHDKATSGFGKIVKDRAKEKGILLLDDVLGLCVFKEDIPVQFGSMSGKLSLLQSAESFVNEFEKALSISPKLSEKYLLAFELYGASHFEISQRAKFLTLISAVESLSEQNLESSTLLEHIDKINEMTKKYLSEPEKSLFLSRIGSLKRESIKKSCKRLVETFIGAKDAEFFENCYNIRSKISHDGEIPDGVNINSDLTKLDDIVSRLLTVLITSKNAISE